MTITNFMIPTILVACLTLGYCIKHIEGLDAISNQFIPSLMALLGAILAVIIALTEKSPITVNTIVFGAFTGVASTGIHQWFKTTLEEDGWFTDILKEMLGDKHE